MGIRDWFKTQALSIALIALGILAVSAMGLYFRNSQLSAELKAANLQVATLQFANSALETSVKEQNKAVEKLQKDKIRRDREAATEIAKAKKASETHVLEASRLLGYQGIGDPCKDATDVISLYLRGAV